jgi:hypothetical protein
MRRKLLGRLSLRSGEPSLSEVNSEVKVISGMAGLDFLQLSSHLYHPQTISLLMYNLLILNQGFTRLPIANKTID